VGNSHVRSRACARSCPPPPLVACVDSAPLVRSARMARVLVPGGQTRVFRELEGPACEMFFLYSNHSRWLFVEWCLLSACGRGVKALFAGEQVDDSSP